MLRSCAILLSLLLAAPVAHAQFSADYYYREERPDPQVVSIRTDSTRSTPSLPDSAARTVSVIQAGGVAPDTARAVALAAYSPAERYQLGRNDARQFYQPATSVFWGTLGSTVALPLVGGVVAASLFATTSPKPVRLRAPASAYLLDAHYHRGYVKQVKLLKLNKAVDGLGVGAGVLLVTYTTVMIIIASSLNFSYILL